jgi:hypothetical protein
MKRLLFTTLLCALGTAHVSAENEVSQQLFDWKEDQRNAAFTDMLWDSNLKCDHVIRTLFTGTFLEWTNGRCFAKTGAPMRSASLETWTTPSSPR